MEKQLRERNFGELNGGSDKRYPDVWAFDSESARHTEFGVESVFEVARRTRGLVEELEGRMEGRTIILVAHGDVLQIMQAGLIMGGEGSREHRKLQHINTADYRLLMF